MGEVAESEPVLRAATEGCGAYLDDRRSLDPNLADQRRAHAKERRDLEREIPNVRQVMLAIDEPVVLANATGCLEVGTTIYPYTAWRVPWIHNAFENAASTISGVEAAYRSLVRQGKIPEQNVKFLAFGGDGGTYDIGLQSLSWAMERGHNMLYVCYDNEAYMNTGIQRSSATPLGAHTSTAPAGTVKQGKEQNRKDLTKIMVAHNIPYVAQTTPFHWKDLATKVEKALSCDGPAFLNILMPCTVGWHFDPALGIDLAREAVETNFWPLFEVENGEWKLNYTPKEKKPLLEWLKPQGRFKHLMSQDKEGVLEWHQKEVDRKWAELLQREQRAQDAPSLAGIRRGAQPQPAGAPEHPNPPRAVVGRPGRLRSGLLQSQLHPVRHLHRDPGRQGDHPLHNPGGPGGSRDAPHQGTVRGEGGIPHRGSGPASSS